MIRKRRGADGFWKVGANLPSRRSPFDDRREAHLIVSKHAPLERESPGQHNIIRIHSADELAIRVIE